MMTRALILILGLIEAIPPNCPRLGNNFVTSMPKDQPATPNRPPVLIDEQVDNFDSQQMWARTRFLSQEERPR
jgi:hypothetical protein